MNAIVLVLILIAVCFILGGLTGSNLLLMIGMLLVGFGLPFSIIYVWVDNAVDSSCETSYTSTCP